MDIKSLGLFFNRTGGNTPTSDDAPDQELTIEKDVLDRSSNEIQGRISFDIDSQSYQMVIYCELDGKHAGSGGIRLPAAVRSGYIDTTLFHYPNSAAAGKPGKHLVTVRVGLCKGFWASVWNLEMPSIQWFSVVTYPITLLPNSPRD